MSILETPPKTTSTTDRLINAFEEHLYADSKTGNNALTIVSRYCEDDFDFDLALQKAKQIIKNRRERPKELQSIDQKEFLNISDVFAKLVELETLLNGNIIDPNRTRHLNAQKLYCLCCLLLAYSESFDRPDLEFSSEYLHKPHTMEVIALASFFFRDSTYSNRELNSLLSHCRTQDNLLFSRGRPERFYRACKYKFNDDKRKSLPEEIIKTIKKLKGEAFTAAEIARKLKIVDNIDSRLIRDVMHYLYIHGDIVLRIPRQDPKTSKLVGCWSKSRTPLFKGNIHNPALLILSYAADNMGEAWLHRIVNNKQCKRRYGVSFSHPSTRKTASKLAEIGLIKINYGFDPKRKVERTKTPCVTICDEHQDTIIKWSKKKPKDKLEDTELLVMEKILGLYH